MDPLAVFGSKALADVGCLLTLHPAEALAASEIRGQLQLNKESTQRALARLTRTGVIRRRRRGSQDFYESDPGHPSFGALRVLALQTGPVARAIEDAAVAVGRGGIETAFVFGSVARGGDTASSDLDLMLLGRAPLHSVREVLGDLDQVLGRRLALVMMTRGEFVAAVEDRRAFAADVVLRPRIMLLGTEADVPKLGEAHARRTVYERAHA